MKKFFLNLVVLLFAVPFIASAVVPTIGISSNKGTNVCSGDTVVYSASITFGGTSPSYQWMVNGNPAGANASTFTVTTLSNNDAISCVLTSNDPAASPTTANSNTIVMNVTTSVTPVIAIQLNPNDTICAGTSVTFTATIGNGGTSPAYQWRRNGAAVGTNSNTYTTTTLASNDTITCVLTSNETCVTTATATSNPIVMTVNPILTPVIAIGANPGNNICVGQNVTFTANTANGGSNPIYTWKRNGVTVGTNSNTYSTTTLANGDNISCELTSSEICVTSSTATSNNINMTVTPNVTPAVSIVASQTNICAGDNVTFTATPTNGGGSPAYQWKVNGANTGPNSNVFITSSLPNGAVVTCVMTSSITCVTSPTATSNPVNMTVNPIITPDVTIVPSPNDTICSGQLTTFTATPVNGGTAPTYQWQINGVNAGTNSIVNTFSRSTFNNGDMVRVIMTGNGVCATKAADTSTSVRMEVIPNVEPVVVITRFPNDTVCDGTNVVFSSNSANGGMTPSYQWQVNNGNVGSNINSYSSASLSNGDVVRLIMTSSITCVTKQADTSNDLVIGVKLKKTPDVTIVVAPNDTICAGDNVTFTATATSTGLPPSYQWQVNGVNAGTNSATFMTNSLTNGASVICIITTADTCVTKNMDTSNAIIMNVKPILTPDVTIVVSPDDTACAGDVVSFTATAVNGGTNPSYQWRVNGGNVGTNSNTYATSSLNSGDVVDCILTSSEMCVSKTNDTSAGITMTIKPKLTPDIQIIVLPNDTVCDGTNVTFVATPTNEGMTPTYQWQVNGTNVGNNASSFSTTALANGDVVRCILTSSELCVTQRMDTSNSINMTVNPNLTPVVTITVSPNDTICTGTSVTFTATPTNGGTAPVYQWRVNGTNAGAGTNMFTTTTLANNDVVDVIMTSSEACVTKAADTSNAINMNVKPYLTPNISMVVAPNDTVCDGTNVTFTATAADTGMTPSYQWQVNGTNVGGSSLTYSSSTLANNDVVRCILTSSEMCVTQVMDTTNEITMTVNPNLTPDVTVVVTPNDTICHGTLTSFIATPTNGGTTPSYQWKINGSNVGIDNSGFSSGSLADGDVVTCVLTSNETCVTRSMDTSAPINMTVIPLTTPTVTISANTGTTSCVNGEVTFNTAATNPGLTQAYQWRLNGADISGANSSTYMSNTLATGDIITCRMDITAACPAPDSAISNALNMTMVTPSFDIVATPNDTICDNEIATYRVINANNVGTYPLYQWNINGVNQLGAVGDSLTLLYVNNQDLIVNSFTGSDNCINAPATPANNTITMTVNPTGAVTVNITANPGNVLTNSDIVFFTSSTNSPTATYQWRKNGVNIPGATGILYTDTNPVDGDSISLMITTTDSCRTPDSVLSNVIVLSVGVSVDDVEKALFDNVVIAPNPNNGTFMLKGNLSANRSDEHVFVEIMNAVGAVVYRQDVSISNNELNTRIELGDRVSSGLHLVRISAEGKTQVLKFIANK